MLRKFLAFLFLALSLTPAHLQKIGLVKDVMSNEKATINSQMKLASRRPSGS